MTQKQNSVGRRDEQGGCRWLCNQGPQQAAVFARGKGALQVHTKALEGLPWPWGQQVCMCFQTANLSVLPLMSIITAGKERKKKIQEITEISQFLRKTEANTRVGQGRGRAKETERNYFQRAGISGERGRLRGLQFL